MRENGEKPLRVHVIYLLDQMGSQDNWAAGIMKAGPVSCPCLLACTVTVLSDTNVV